MVSPAMRVVCAWCGAVLVEGPAEEISHGICPTCERGWLERGGLSPSRAEARHLRAIETFADQHEHCAGRLPRTVHRRDPFDPPVDAELVCDACGTQFHMHAWRSDDEHVAWIVQKRRALAARREFEQMTGHGPAGVQ